MSSEHRINPGARFYQCVVLMAVSAVALLIDIQDRFSRCLCHLESLLQPADDSES